MKMYSKENQCMVDVTKISFKGNDIEMKCKLMNAYNMKIYLRPEELRSALSLVDWELLKGLPAMLVSGTEGEETFKKIGADIAASTSDSFKLLLGERGMEKVDDVKKALGANLVDTLMNSLLSLLPVLLADKK